MPAKIVCVEPKVGMPLNIVRISSVSIGAASMQTRAAISLGVDINAVAGAISSPRSRNFAPHFSDASRCQCCSPPMSM